MRSYSQIRLTDPEQSVHARDTWQHADRYRTVTVPPRHPKNRASDGSMLVRVSVTLTDADARRRTSEARS